MNIPLKHWYLLNLNLSCEPNVDTRAAAISCSTISLCFHETSAALSFQVGYIKGGNSRDWQAQHLVFRHITLLLRP